MLQATSNILSHVSSEGMPHGIETTGVQPKGGVHKHLR